VNTRSSVSSNTTAATTTGTGKANAGSKSRNSLVRKAGASAIKSAGGGLAVYSSEGQYASGGDLGDVMVRASAALRNLLVCSGNHSRLTQVRT
jgi:hypothetical protein